MFDRPELNNEHFEDCYFSYDDGLSEALYVFIDGNGLPSRIKPNRPFVVGETGFGTGLNLLALLHALRKENIVDFKLYFFSVELHPLSRSRIEELLASFASELKDELEIFLPFWDSLYENLVDGWNEATLDIFGGSVELHLYNGHISKMMSSVAINADAWFLDGHSPDKNTEMWKPAVMSFVGENSGVNSTVATFTAAGIVKRGLKDAGFEIKRREGFGGKRHMIFGEFIDSETETEELNY
jgi:tRNA 5-methylaminomethyl-2-thiouridine biosynthesis bifunctional protein